MGWALGGMVFFPGDFEVSPQLLPASLLCLLQQEHCTVWAAPQAEYVELLLLMHNMLLCFTSLLNFGI